MARDVALAEQKKWGPVDKYVDVEVALKGYICGNTLWFEGRQFLWRNMYGVVIRPGVKLLEGSFAKAPSGNCTIGKVSGVKLLVYGLPAEQIKLLRQQPWVRRVRVVDKFEL
jgi:hypothetical protein